MGCDALNLGAQDLAAGLDVIKELAVRAEFPFISANIRDELEMPIFKPYHIVRRDGITTGIIGLTSSFNHPDITFADPVETLLELVDEVNRQCDLVVLLFHATESDIARVRELDIPIDLVMQSKSRRRSNDGGQYGLPIFSLGTRGKYVYQFDIEIKEPGSKLVDLSANFANLDRMENQIKLIQHGDNTVQLDPSDPDQQRIAREVENLKVQIQKVQHTIDQAVNSISFQIHDVKLEIPERVDIRTIVEAGKRRRSRLDHDAEEPAVPYVPGSGG